MTQSWLQKWIVVPMTLLISTICLTSVVMANPNHWKGVVWGGAWTYASGNQNLECIVGAKLAGAGAHWVRMVAARNDSLYNIDRRVRTAKAHGMNIIFYYQKGDPTKTYGTISEEQANADWLRALARRYANDVTYWEIHNEPNLNDYWDSPLTTGGVSKYVQHLRNSRQAILVGNPNAKIVLAGISEYAAETWFGMFNTVTIDDGGVQKTGWAFIDEICLHPYAPNQQNNGRYGYATGSRNRLIAMRNAIPEAYRSLPTWITEVGFHHQSAWSSPGKVEDAERKRVELNAVYDYILAELPGGADRRPIFWYTVHQDSSAVGYGLLTVQSGHTSVNPTVVNEIAYGNPSLPGYQQKNDGGPAPTPTVPANASTPSVVAGNGKCELRWTSASGAMHYRILRSTSPTTGFTLIGRTVANVYKDTGLTNGTTYYYKLRPVNSKGWSSADSSVGSAQPSSSVPAAPTLSGTVGTSTFNLSWTTVSGVTQYELRRYFVSGGPDEIVTRITGTSFSDTIPRTGVTYYYRVVSVNSSGRISNDSNEIALKKN